MPLTREEKAEIIAEMQGRLEASPIIYLTDFQGLSVDEANDLRARFYDAGVEFTVVKNTLLRMAMERLEGFDELFEHLSGPTAVALTEEPAAPARVIRDFIEEHGTERPALKAALVDGAFYDGDSLEDLAKLKSKDELIGEVVSLLEAPLRNVISGLTAQGEQLAAIAQTLAEREEE